MDCTLDSLFLATILPSNAFERSAVIPSTENSSTSIGHLLGSWVPGTLQSQGCLIALGHTLGN
eukprot:5616675-Amphidinium_carterae.1